MCMVMLLCYGSLVAQEDEVYTTETQQLMELLMENDDRAEVDFTTLMDQLEAWRDHPINLNRCTQHELEQLPFLSPMQCAAIVEHRALAGPFISTLELQGIDGLDLVTIRVLLSFVVVSGDEDRRQISWTGIQDDGKVEAFVRTQRVLEQQRAYQEEHQGSYYGSPYRVLSRVRFRYHDAISVGLTMEKDPGEAFFRPPQRRGFNFYSGHIAVGKQGVLDQLIIGDYQAQFGQGLVAWSGMAFGKSGDILTTKRNARGVLPYVSADENNFLRGAITSLRWGRWLATSFVSRLARDASVSDSLMEDGRQVFGALQRTGLHATESQWQGKDAVRLTVIGQHLRWNGDRLQLGVSGVRLSHNAWHAEATQVYRSFDQIPTALLVGGVDYQWSYRNLMAYGELAMCDDGRKALLNGLMCSLSDQVNVSLVHRSYDLGFHHELSNAFGEGSRVSNEQGLFIGSQVRLNRRWKLKGYADLYRFPWLRFRVDGPSSGREYWLQLDHRPRRNLELYARFRMEEREQNALMESQSTAFLALQRRRDVRLNATYALSDQLEVRNRLELVWVNHEVDGFEQGVMLYQDLIWKPRWPKPYQFKLRYALFDTDGFDSRIYAYEHDLRYSFSIPAFFDRGSRFYVFASYRLSHWGKLSLRYAQTYYSNRNSVGSGWNTIDGPRASDLRIQLKLKF